MKEKLKGLPIVFHCDLESEEYIKVDSHQFGALFEMHSPSQLNMGEIPSVVLNDLDISNMINTLKCIQNERGIKL